MTELAASGVTPLEGGNYVVSSPFWDNGAATNAGAVTFGSGTNGEWSAWSPRQTRWSEPLQMTKLATPQRDAAGGRQLRRQQPLLG